MKKTINNSFLVVGNTIGSGILALPLVTAVYGFIPSTLMLIFAWIVMSFSAKLLLEASYWVRGEENLMSILSKTLWPQAKIAVSLLYVCMLYALLVAYISIGVDIAQAVMAKWFAISIPIAIIVCLFTLFFGMVVFYKMDLLERYNSYLVSILLTIFLFMVFTAIPHITLKNLAYYDFSGIVWIFPLAILCYGYPTIVPSLRSHCGEDKKRILRVLSLGGVISLLMYILWQLAVLGTLPFEGELGIRALPEQNISSLSAILHAVTQSPYLPAGLIIFAYFAIVTSFMSIAKILVDFLNDSFMILGVKNYRISAQVLTLVPPVLISIFVPGLFVYALMFGGSIIGILLVFLPAIIVWHGRYYKNLSHEYQCGGGKPLLLFMMCTGIFVGVIETIHKIFY